MKHRVLLGVAAVGLGLAGGCGADTQGGGGDAGWDWDAGRHHSGMFWCGDSHPQCDSSFQYCHDVRYGGEVMPDKYECRPIPLVCILDASCECLEAAVPDDQKGLSCGNEYASYCNDTRDGLRTCELVV